MITKQHAESMLREIGAAEAETLAEYDDPLARIAIKHMASRAREVVRLHRIAELEMLIEASA